ncbi:MAG TPA: DUF6335 family protein [Vicinamibacterales bacterium]|jgi:hypothetical protein
MAKRPAARRPKRSKSARKRSSARRPAKRLATKRQPKKTAANRKKPARKRVAARATKARTRSRTPAAARSPKRAAAGPSKAPRLDRVRRTLDETVQTPPSSLNMDRHGSAARTGRAELAESRYEHRGMSPAITGGDVDVDLENAYFTGDEAPGGDNPTPDQEVVDDIGKALGVEYQDDEELKASDKVTERDRHRWELDPASSEDYKERKK